VNISENNLVRVLTETGFVQESMLMESVLADRPGRHYQGLSARVGERRVYVSLDIDALDPSYAPGVGTPFTKVAIMRSRGNQVGLFE